MSKVIMVFVTCAGKDEARRLADILLQARLAACVNIFGGVESFFRWQGKIDRAEEHLLIIKTQAALFEELAQRIKQHHAYDTPEIIALPIVDGSADYLSWIEEETRPCN